MRSPEENPPAVEAARPPAESLITITNVVYALQAVGLLLPVTFVVAVVINYVKRDDARGTILESHFRWQIRTFWFGLLWAIVGGLTAPVLIGFVVLAANVIWIIYRVVKGWLDLVDRKRMYRGEAA